MKMSVLGKPITAVAICFLMVALMNPFAIAQEKSTDDMQMLIEKIKADKKLLVAENMQLSKAEAKKFWPVYDQYQNEMFILRMRSLNLVGNYAGSYDSMTNDIAKKLLDEYMTIERLRQKVRDVYLPKFRKVLPEIKVARYYQIENKINAVVSFELAKQIPLVKTNK
jgi:hypothetical protein